MGNGWENCAIVTVQKVVIDVSQVKIKVELKVLRTFSQYWRKKPLARILTNCAGYDVRVRALT